MLYFFCHPITDDPMAVSLDNVRDIRVMEDSTKSRRNPLRYAVRIVHFGESLPMVIDGLYHGDACELVEKIFRKIKENA